MHKINQEEERFVPGVFPVGLNDHLQSKKMREERLTTPLPSPHTITERRVTVSGWPPPEPDSPTR
jgi:hypothetical protein